MTTYFKRRKVVYAKSRGVQRTKMNWIFRNHSCDFFYSTSRNLNAKVYSMNSFFFAPLARIYLSYELLIYRIIDFPLRVGFKNNFENKIELHGFRRFARVLKNYSSKRGGSIDRDVLAFRVPIRAARGGECRETVIKSSEARAYFGCVWFSDSARDVEGRFDVNQRDFLQL